MRLFAIAAVLLISVSACVTIQPIADSPSEHEPTERSVEESSTDRSQIPTVVNAAVGSPSHELQARFPAMARMAQITPSQIHPRLGHKTATAGIFESEVRLSLRSRARAQFLRVVRSFQQKHGVTPWGVYCDEIRVDPAPSFNPLELFWLSRTKLSHRGVSSTALLARSDALVACIEQIHLGFMDASSELEGSSGVLVVPITGMTAGPKQRDQRTLQSYKDAAPEFAARHPNLNLTWVVIWDYWGLGADRDAAGFSRRSSAWWTANRLAFDCPVIRVGRPVKMGNTGQVVVDANGQAVPWSDEQLHAWWDATPSPPNGDPKGIWGSSDGANRSNFQATAPRVAEFMLNRQSDTE